MKLFSKTFAIISALATVRVVAGTAIEGYADGLMGFSGTIGDFPIVANGTAQVCIALQMVITFTNNYRASSTKLKLCIQVSHNQETSLLLLVECWKSEQMFKSDSLSKK